MQAYFVSHRALPHVAGSPQMTAVREQVRRYLGDYFMTAAPPHDAALLVDDLGADSLDLLQVVHTLNDLFRIDIDVDWLHEMLTVGGACDLVERLCGCENSGAQEV